VPFGSSRYPSSGAVSSLASAPRRDSITHTCKPLTRSLNRHHICTHKAIPLRRRPRRLRRHRLRRTAAPGGGSAAAATARLRRNRQRRRRRNRQRRQNRWRPRVLVAAAEISSGDTAAALAVSAVAAVAAVRGGADLDGEQCTCFAHAAALSRPFSSPPLGHQVAWSKHLCKLQRGSW